jgi:rod shape-determining protein MreC
MARNRKQLIYIVLIGIVVLLNLPLPASLSARVAARESSGPFLNFMSYITFRIREGFGIFFEAAEAVNEKEALMTEVTELRLRVKESETFAQENEELRELLGFKDREKRKLVLAEVIGRGDTSGWWQTITINRGTEDAVTSDMPVITMDGLVGRTRQGVSRHSCDVTLITEPTLQVACRMSASGAYGVMRGSGVKASGKGDVEMLCSASPAELEYLDKTSDINTGEEVLTSGLGGVFPQGIRVGYVKKITMDESGLFKRAQVKPAAKLEQLRYVFVVVE